MSIYLPNPETEVIESFNGEIREFQVTDPKKLKVPGLVELEGVIIDGVNLPIMEDRPFQQAVEPGAEPTVTYEPVYMVMHCYSEEDGPFLERQVFSNNGEWQVGSKVKVAGTWDEAPESFVSSLDVAELESSKDAEIAKLKEKAEAAQAKKDAEIAKLKAENAKLKQGSK